MGQPVSTYRFILLPSLVGLICYACSQTPKTATIEQTADVSQPQGEKSSANSKTAVQSANPSSHFTTDATSPVTSQSTIASFAYQEGINLASSAHQLSKFALSPDDWELIASRWQRAIERLKQVRSGDSDYAAAQTKIAEYNRNAEYAAARIRALQTSANTAVANRSTNANTVASNTIASQPAPPPATAPQTAVPSSATAPPRISSITASLNTVVVPVVRRLHGTPVVQVTFNGLKTYDMILDTGASRTLITREMANALNVVSTEQMVAATASSAEVVFELGRMDSISMGSIAINNAQVSIGDSIGVGLLGNDFLRGYDVTIRSRENVVELVQSR